MINNFLRFAVLPLTFCFFSVAPSFSTENQFPDSMVYHETKLLLNGRTLIFYRDRLRHQLDQKLANTQFLDRKNW